MTVRWIETCAESAGAEFLEGVIPGLRSFGSQGEVRGVYWFDE